jgi:hypothetical protein
MQYFDGSVTPIEAVFPAWSVPKAYKRSEYFHRDPASRRRRRKGKSRIWDSKIWSRVPRDSDPRKTALARRSSMYKRQTHPLVREGASRKQDRNCQTVMSPWWGSTPRLTRWPLVAMSLWLWLEIQFSRKLKERLETRSTGEYRMSAFEDFACEFTCAVLQWYWVCDPVRLL